MLKSEVKSRGEYCDFCWQEVQKFLLAHKGHVLIEYIRLPFVVHYVDKMSNKQKVINKGQPTGVVVSFQDPKNKDIKFGWSLCHVGKDSYNKHIALWQAIERALKPEPTEVFEKRYKSIFETKVQKMMEPMKNRAKKYFKV